MATRNVLGALSDSNQVVVLALELAGNLIPLVKGTINEIRSIAAAKDTATYEIVVQADAAELDAITKMAADDLTALNAELRRLGVPPVPPYEKPSSS